jgi:predicted ATPase
LQASLLARLDRLAPVREVAQIGAALGRQFSHNLLAAVTPMPPPQLDDALAQLVGAELIYRRGTPPDAEYTFKHALVQDAAYSTLLRSRRQQLHARIAGALERGFPDIVAAQPALLAHHCDEAGLPEKAIEYWLTAGRQASRRSAAEEAVALLNRGLARVPALPDGDRRRETELDLQIALGQALNAGQSWGTPKAGEAYARARELSVTLSRPRALLSALFGQWVNHATRADLEVARQLASEIVSLGEVSGDAAMRAMGYGAGALTHNFRGEFTAARAHAENGLTFYDPAHRLFYAELLPFDMLVALLDYLALPTACLGYLYQASLRAHTALAEARRLSHPLALADALAWTFWIGWCARSDPKSVLELGDELLALAVRHEFALYRAGGLIFRGWCLAALGRADEGIPLLSTGLGRMHDVGFMAHTPACLTLLSDACRMAGRCQAALGHLAEARHFAAETGERWALAEVLRLRGEVLLATGDAAAAEASYREALNIAEEQEAKLWELRAATSLARLWRDQSKHAEARELLAPVYGWFTEGFGTPVLQEAKALLDELA